MKKMIFVVITSMAGVVLNAQMPLRIDASIYSAALDTVKMIDIFLPFDYYQHPERQHAVIYYLHGAATNQNSAQQYAQFYYLSHEADSTITSPPAIVVCPDGSCEPYLGSGYLNSALYGNHEDYFLYEVIPFIEDEFRVVQDKNFHLLCGTSMGGTSSVRLCTSYPEMFRAAATFLGMPGGDTALITTWRQLCYNETGSYVLDYDAGVYNKLMITMCGGASPNLEVEPYYVEVPWDTNGILVDSVVDRWMEHDFSEYVKDLPDENELSWFLSTGMSDEMYTYPSNLKFADSLDHYGIGYTTHYFEGGHEFNLDAWMHGFHWMDSIINLSFQTMGVDRSSVISRQSSVTVYPNPTSGVSSFVFRVPCSGNVSLKIYDLQGREVATVVDRVMPAGEHVVSFDASGLPAGVFIYRELSVAKSASGGSSVFSRQTSAGKLIKY